MKKNVVEQAVRLARDLTKPRGTTPLLASANAAAPVPGSDAACAPARSGAGSRGSKCNMWRLKDPRQLTEIRAAMRTASPRRIDLSAQLEPMSCYTPPTWREYGNRRTMRSGVEEIYLMGPHGASSKWQAVAKLARQVHWEEGSLTYSASPGLLWDRQGDERPVMAWLLAGDLGVLCAHEAINLASRAVVTELSPRATCYEHTAWFDIRGVELFASEFVRALEEGRAIAGGSCAPIASAVVDLPWAWKSV